MSREALLRELRGLKQRELERILNAFAEDDRERVIALISPPAKPAAEVPFAMLAGLSPWLLKAIEPGQPPLRDKLTPATRLAVSAALERTALQHEQSPRRHIGASGTFIGRFLRKRREGKAR
jgi:hypothetical protein